MERYIAIDNVCAWPNLTLMPGGDIIATIFNQPCHGLWEGDVDGQTWGRHRVTALKPTHISAIIWQYTAGHRMNWGYRAK